MQKSPMMFGRTGPSSLAPVPLTTANAMKYAQAQQLAAQRAGNPRLTTANSMTYVDVLRQVMAQNPAMTYLQAHEIIVRARPDLRQQGMDYMQALQLAAEAEGRQGNPVPPKAALIRKAIRAASGPQQLAPTPEPGYQLYLIPGAGKKGTFVVALKQFGYFPMKYEVDYERVAGNKARILQTTGPAAAWKGKVVPIKMAANPAPRRGMRGDKRWRGPDAAGVCFDDQAGVFWAANQFGPDPSHPMYGIGGKIVSHTGQPSGAKYPAGVKPTNNWAHVKHEAWGIVLVPICRQSGAGAPLARGRGGTAQPTAGPGGLPGGSGKPSPTQMQGFISEDKPWPVQPGGGAEVKPCPPGCELVDVEKTGVDYATAQKLWGLTSPYICAERRKFPFFGRTHTYKGKCFAYKIPGSWKGQQGNPARRGSAFVSPLAPTRAGKGAPSGEKKEAPNLLQSCPPGYYFAFGWGCLPIKKGNPDGRAMWDTAGVQAQSGCPGQIRCPDGKCVDSVTACTPGQVQMHPAAAALAPRQPGARRRNPGPPRKSRSADDVVYGIYTWSGREFFHNDEGGAKRHGQQIVKATGMPAKLATYRGDGKGGWIFVPLSAGNPTAGARKLQKEMRRKLEHGRKGNPGCSACRTKVPGGVM